MTFFDLRYWLLTADCRRTPTQGTWCYCRVSYNVVTRFIPSESLEVCVLGQCFPSLGSPVVESSPGCIYLVLLFLNQGQLRVVILWEETRLELCKGKIVAKSFKYFSFYTVAYFASDRG